MLRRLLFDTVLGEMFLGWLENRCGLAIVEADDLDLLGDALVYRIGAR